MFAGFVPILEAKSNSIIGLATGLAPANTPVLSGLNLCCTTKLAIFLGSVLGDLGPTCHI